MAILHILAHSPFSDGRFASCLSLLKAGSGQAVLLTGDAVYALLPETAPRKLLQQLAEGQLFALAEDAVARNVQHHIPHAEMLVDYAGFVALCDRYPRINSWL